jgi:hypothetical protein
LQLPDPPSEVDANLEDDEWEELAEFVFSESPQLGSRSEAAGPPDRKNPLTQALAAQSDNQSELDNFDDIEDEEPELPTSAPTGFSDLSGGPPPRKRPK